MKLGKKTKEKIAFVLLISGGIGLCIGGMWLPPLLVMGAPMLAGGLAILSNYLQDKDRFTINNNYGDIEAPKMTYDDSVSIAPKQRLAALFAFKNSKYAMHHENTHEHIKLNKDVIEEIQQINDLINSMDFQELKDCVEMYNISQEEEKKSIDNHKSLRI